MTLPISSARMNPAWGQGAAEKDRAHAKPGRAKLFIHG